MSGLNTPQQQAVAYTAGPLLVLAGALAGPLGMTSAAVLAKLQHPSSPDYVLLADKVPAQNSGQITAMDLPGIYQTASYARSYPDGSVAANLIARYIERYRWIGWGGLIVILWVAGKMIWDGYHDVAPVLGWPSAKAV